MELRQQYPLTLLLQIAKLPRSTFYYHVKLQTLPDKQDGLKQQILAIYHQHKGRYGYRRITLAIRQQGHLVNHKSVQSLMRQLRLKSCIRRKKYCSYKGTAGGVAPNLLQRQFRTDRPNQKWVTDVTEFLVAGQKLYLSPILDLYNGEIISYQMAHRPALEMVTGMLKTAFSRLKRDEKPLLHSDQGWQYQMSAYRKLLEQQHITQSMSRRGNCLDNAAMESFFGTLKAECLHLQKFDDIDQLRTELDQYIHYYNHKRIKLRLKGLSPVKYRMRFAQIS